MSECMEWTGALWVNGYPQAWNKDGKKIRAHRYIWEWVNGRKLKPWPEEVVLHTCDNRKCINPEHMVAGTQAENLADMWSKGRGFTPAREQYKDACKKGHPWTDASTYVDPDGYRCCRICKSERQRKARAAA